MNLVLGLSKFAKLARSVTRSRQFSAHLPALKDTGRQSNIGHVSKATNSEWIASNLYIKTIDKAIHVPQFCVVNTLN